MTRRIEGPCHWCGTRCRSTRRLCQVCTLTSRFDRDPEPTYSEALTGGHWVRGKGGVQRWVPARAS